MSLLSFYPYFFHCSLFVLFLSLLLPTLPSLILPFLSSFTSPLLSVLLSLLLYFLVFLFFCIHLFAFPYSFILFLSSSFPFFFVLNFLPLLPYCLFSYIFIYLLIYIFVSLGVSYLSAYLFHFNPATCHYPAGFIALRSIRHHPHPHPQHPQLECRSGPHVSDISNGELCPSME